MEPQVDPLGADDPDRIGPFALLGVLGTGGMGRVYLGESQGGRKVAVKVVRPTLADEPEFRSRFRREVEAARQMNSIYTAGLVDADPDAAQPWMATRFINGRSLQQQIRADGPLDADAVLTLGLGVAEALSTIHAAGYVHRDLKPSNVVIDQYGPHVIDFGIISNALADSVLTRTGQVIGTPGYMSPEQLMGWRIDGATDVYAFGALLHFAATGFPPPVAASGEPDAAALSDPRLAEIVGACLARDPQGRPTASALVHRLSAALPGTAASGGAASGGAADSASVRSTVSAQKVPASAGGVATVPPATTGSTPSGGTSISSPGSSAWGSGSAPGGPAPAPAGPARRRVLAAAAAVAVLAAAGLLVPQLWGQPDPAPTSACPALPGDGGMTFVRAAADGECYGLADSALAADGPEAGFGRDPVARRLQAKLFSSNRLTLPVTADDLTVVWLGALSCPAYGADGTTCADGREYDAERQELQALQLAQSRGDLRGRVHVVIANAGADMRHAQDVAALLVAHRAAFGRLVVLGGGDSRAVTKTAIRTLVGAGVPVVAPELSSDDEGPGTPFVDAPGYLQLTGPNQAWASSAVSFVARYTPPGGRQLLVYHVPDPSDLYAESLARDLQFAARDEPRTAAQPARIIGSAAEIPRTVCLDQAGGQGAGGDTPAALFFADRWNTFGALADRLTELCGARGPALVIGNDSVNRFMTNDAARSAVRAPWPLAYFTNGVQCAEVEAAARRDPGGEAAALLAATRTLLRACDPAAGSQQMGDGVSRFWDAVALADKVVPGGGGTALADVVFDGANGRVTVRDGRVVRDPKNRPQLLCVLTVDRSGTGDRSVANCDRAFTGR